MVLGKAGPHPEAFYWRTKQLRIKNMVRKVHGDITQMEADVIVNAANTQLFHGGGVAKRIVQIGGKAVEKESEQVGFCLLGDFAATTAGNLKAKAIAHIPTIDYVHGNGRISYEDLEGAWRKVLEWVSEEGYKSVATPLLGAGVVGLDGNFVDELLCRIGKEFPDLDITIVIYP